MSKKNIYEKKEEDILCYLQKKGYSIEKFNSVISKTLVVVFSGKENESVNFSVDMQKYNIKFPDSLKNSCGFTYPVTDKINGKYVNVKNILGFNSKNAKKINIITIIHEYLHLLSQKETEKEDGSLVIKSGFSTFNYNIDGTFKYNAKIENLNEGVTEYLAKKIKDEIYGEYKYIDSGYVYADIISVLSAFVFRENYIDSLLKLYMCNNVDAFFSKIEEEINITKESILNINVKMKRFIKKLTKKFLEKYDEENLKKIYINILKELPESQYKRTHKMLQKYLR